MPLTRQLVATSKGHLQTRGNCVTDIYISPLDYSVLLVVGQDSAVGVATRYGLDCPGIESRWERDFPHPSRPTLGPTQPPLQ